LALHLDCLLHPTCQLTQADGPSWGKARLRPVSCRALARPCPCAAGGKGATAMIQMCC